MSNKSDKPLALKTIFGSLAAIIIFYILFAVFSHQVAGNFRNPIYVTGVIIGGILFFLGSVWAYKVADGTKYDNASRAVVWILAILIIAWAGGWVAGSNEKVEKGSPQMEDIEKAKVESLYIDTNHLPAKIPE